jgi:hypothetical protein
MVGCLQLLPQVASAQQPKPDEAASGKESGDPLPLGTVTQLAGLEFAVSKLGERNIDWWAGWLGLGGVFSQMRGKLLEHGGGTIRAEFSDRGASLALTGTYTASKPIGGDHVALLVGGAVVYPKFMWSGDDAQFEFIEVPLRFDAGVWAGGGGVQVLLHGGYGVSVGSLGPDTFKSSFGFHLEFLSPLLGLSAEAVRYDTTTPTDRFESSASLNLTRWVAIGARGEVTVERAEPFQPLWAVPGMSEHPRYQVSAFLRFGDRARDDR